MNEEYLRCFRKLPDSRLAERIHTRLEKKERMQRIKRYSFLSVLALTFVSGMLMIFSSSVRADVISIFMKIGGVQYQVTSGPLSNPYIPTVEIQPRDLPWEEASTHFLSPLQLPAYVPPGYEREANTKFFSGEMAIPRLK